MMMMMYDLIKSRVWCSSSSGSSGSDGVSSSSGSDGVSSSEVEGSGSSSGSRDIRSTENTPLLSL